MLERSPHRLRAISRLVLYVFDGIYPLSRASPVNWPVASNGLQIRRHASIHPWNMHVVNMPLVNTEVKRYLVSEQVQGRLGGDRFADQEAPWDRASRGISCLSRRQPRAPLK